MQTNAAQTKADPNEVQQVAAERVRLLALKYAGTATDEDLVLLEKLNQRIGELCPRVTPEQWKALEESAQLLETLRAKRTERSERLDLNKS